MEALRVVASRVENAAVVRKFEVAEVALLSLSFSHFLVSFLVYLSFYIWSQMTK